MRDRKPDIQATNRCFMVVADHRSRRGSRHSLPIAIVLVRSGAAGFWKE